MHSSSVSNFPVFSSNNEQYTISETSPVGTRVTTVSSFGNTPGTSIRYYIAGGNVDTAFALSSEGVLQTTSSLDYERAAQYTLWLEARVYGTDLASYQQITLDITDDNDNSPVFEPDLYNETVMESNDFVAPVQIAVVMATDLDSDSNGRLTYSLADETSSDVAEAFSVNSLTGEVRCMQSLDREERDSYTLLIQATDQVNYITNNINRNATENCILYVSGNSSVTSEKCKIVNLWLSSSYRAGLLVLGQLLYTYLLEIVMTSHHCLPSTSLAMCLRMFLLATLC